MDLKFVDLQNACKEAEVHAGSDSVEWTAKYPERKHQERGKYEKHACYYEIVCVEEKFLKGVEIFCRPYNVGSFYSAGKHTGRLGGRLNKEDFLLAVRLFKQAGIMPSNTEPSWNDTEGNLLHFPKQDWEKDSLYIALSHYRLIDTRPDLVWKMLRLWEHYRPSKVSFLQVFFYALRNVVLGTQHYCLPTMEYLPSILGSVLFLRTPIKDRPSLLKPYYTQTQVATVSRLIGLGSGLLASKTMPVVVSAEAIMYPENRLFFGRKISSEFLKENIKDFKF